MNNKSVVVMIFAAMVLIAGVCQAQDTWLDTGIGAVSPQGNVLAIERLDADTVLNFSWDNSSRTYLVIVLDNNGNLKASPFGGYPYLYFDVYASYAEVYGAMPGGRWVYVGRTR